MKTNDAVREKLIELYGLASAGDEGISIFPRYGETEKLRDILKCYKAERVPQVLGQYAEQLRAEHERCKAADCKRISREPGPYDLW